MRKWNKKFRHRFANKFVSGIIWVENKKEDSGMFNRVPTSEYLVGT